MAAFVYKLAGVFDGCWHYAKITVDTFDDVQPLATLSPKVFAWLKDDYGPDAWEWSVCDRYREAAIFGATYALHNVPADVDASMRVEVTEIRAHPAHTSWDSVAYATCFAAWGALRTAGANHPYWKGGQAVFPAQAQPDDRSANRVW